MDETLTWQMIMEFLRSDLPPEHKVTAIRLALDAWRHWYDNKYR